MKALVSNHLRERSRGARSAPAAGFDRGWRVPVPAGRYRTYAAPEYASRKRHNGFPWLARSSKCHAGARRHFRGRRVQHGGTEMIQKLSAEGMLQLSNTRCGQPQLLGYLARPVACSEQGENLFLPRSNLGRTQEIRVIHLHPDALKRSAPHASILKGLGSIPRISSDRDGIHVVNAETPQLLGLPGHGIRRSRSGEFPAAPRDAGRELRRRRRRVRLRPRRRVPVQGLCVNRRTWSS